MPSHHSASALAFISLFSPAWAALSYGETCPAGFERQVTSWISCGAGADDPTQCATVDVPLDYTDPTNTAKTLRIPMVRLPRKDQYANEERFAIFYNPGGPGGSGVGGVAGSSFVYDLVGGRYDVIGFDPRGVALSNPFCTSNNQSTNYQCADTGSSYPYETDAQLTTAISVANTQASACASNPDGGSPGDGPGGWGKYIGTAWVARDIVAMSNAINPNKQVRYYRASYGTLLGVTLGAMFPNKIDRLVVDRNINPLDYYFGDGSETPAAADLSVSHFLDECAKNVNGNCALNTGSVTGAQLQAKWDAYLAQLYDENQQDWWTAKQNMNSALKGGPSKWVQYAKDLKSAWASAGITKRDQISATGSSGAAADAAEKQQESYNILNAVACGDYQGRAQNPPTLDDFRKTRAAWNQSSKYMYDQYLSLQFQCDAWQTDAIEQFNYPANGNNPQTPILLVNSLYDPVTPLLSANHSRDTFVAGKAGVLISAGAGHVSNAQNVDTLNTQIKSYLDSGNLPDTSKIYTTPVNGFDEPQSGNSDQTDADQNVTKKRGFVFSKELMNAPVRSSQFSKRGLVPVGCEPINGTVISTTTTTTATTTSTTTTSLSTTTTTTSTATTSTTTTSTASTSMTTTTSTASTSQTTTTTTPTSLTTTTSTTTTSTASTSMTTTTGSASTSKTTTATTSTSVTGTTSTTTSSYSSSYTSTTTCSTTYTGSFTFSTSTSSGFSFTVSPTYGSTTSKPSGGLPIGLSSYTTASSQPYGVGWDSWVSTTTTTKPSPLSTWATWKTTTTPAIDPNWADWGSWSYSTVVSTISKCPSFIQRCQDIVTTKTVSYKAPYPTVTAYTTAFVNVCPTGLITNTVTLTASCKDGCSVKPTGVPAGYTLIQVWCEACATPTFVAVTTSYVNYDPAGSWPGTTMSKKPDASSKASSGAVAATWSGWNSAVTSGKIPDAASKTVSSSMGGPEATWSAGSGPSGIIKPYTGAATRQIAGLGSFVVAMMAAMLLL